MPDFDPHTVRPRFPALARTVDGHPAVYFDGPAGSQVPQSVADAVSHYLLHTNANHAGAFATSRESDALLDEAHRALADLFGSGDPGTVVFGNNMTSLVFALSRALAQTWQPGDEVVVTRLDHDANVTPWILAARDAGATVRHVGVNPEDCTLRHDELESALNERTKLVAVGYASNLVGTINPVAEIVRAAHAVGALAFVDAVHFAPHGEIDVQALDCDLLAASAYKFFGPHVGVLYGKRKLLEGLQPYKLRPAPDDLPGRWMTGTQNHEGICGAAAAVDYLAELGRDGTSADAETDRRAALQSAFDRIRAYETQLAGRLVEGLESVPGLKVWGITSRDRLHERTPTVSFTHERETPQEIARFLAARGVFTWDGHAYALPLTEALGLEPEGVLRVGLLHYNTAEEVDRLLSLLHERLA